MKVKTIPYSSPLAKKLDAQSNRRSFAFLYVTNQCNLKCVHCSFQSAPEKVDSHMNTELMLQTMDELMDIHDITMTGGEPLLHPDFEKILSHAAKNVSLVYLMTNGINLIGKEYLKELSKKGDLLKLKEELKRAMEWFPENLHLFFPLDSFHIKAFKAFEFLLKGLAELAKEWNLISDRPFIGFLSNEVSPEKSEYLINKFKVMPCCHVGTATFSPWRNESDIRGWYSSHNLNQVPFPGGIYINYKGVYLNEASLLVDLRQGIETPLKIGCLNPKNKSKKQLYEIYRSSKLESKKVISKKETVLFKSNN
jgi:organic radical activating enzyme